MARIARLYPMNANTQLIADIRSRLADERPLSDESKLRFLRKIERAMVDPLPDEHSALEELRQQIMNLPHIENHAPRRRGKLPEAPR
jgi:hypothetical protein